MPARLDMARYVRLVASVLVVLDRTFDDALREFSCDILRDLRISASLSPTEIHAAVPLCVHHSLEGKDALRAASAVVQTLWAEKIQSTSMPNR
jgi:hypothetical protein